MRVRLLLLSCAVLLSQAACGNKIECGAGTVEANGRCVVENADPDLKCGAGTEEQEGQCVVTGEMVTCGAGTMLDANSGECVASETTSCGTNTAYDETSDSCLPTDMVCASGTTFDANMGVCLPDVACETGDVVMDGICVGPFEELWAAATVVSVENDDPGFGGTATPITLAAAGTELVLGGTVDAASDLDGDGVLDNDRDVFEFTTAGPLWLTIAVQSDTDALVGFGVVNEDESWGRGSPFVGPRGNAREVLIPAAGTYRLQVGSGILGHGAGARWVASVQVDPLPTPIAFTFGDVIDGDLDNPETGLFDADNFDGVGTLLPTDWPVQATAVIMQLDGAEWRPVGELREFVSDLTLLGAGGLTFLIDPVEYGPSLDRTYSVDSAEAAQIELGPITVGQTITSPPTMIGPGTIFTVDAPAGVVLDVQTVVPEPLDIEVLSPFSGPIRPLSPDTGVAIPVLQGGLVAFRIGGPPLPDVEVSVTAYQPTDLGTVAAQDSLPANVGDLTGPAFYTVSFSAGDIARVRQTNTAGVGIELSWWGSDWVVDDRGPLQDSAGSFGTRARSFVVGSGAQLFEVRPEFNSTVTQLTVTFSGVGTTPLGDFDLGETLSINDPSPRTPGEDQFYSFTVNAEAVAVGTIEASGADVDGRITDSMGNEVWRGATGGGEDVAVVLPAGDYTLSVIPFVHLPTGFSVSINLGGLPSTTEVEPNDTYDTASAGLVLGTPVLGTNDGDPDWYSFTVAQPGIFGFSVASLGNSGGAPFVEVADSMGVLLGSSSGLDADRSGFLEAGDYTLEVSGPGNGEQYILTASRQDSGATVDDAGQNDTSAMAQTLSNIPGDSVAGVLLDGDEDWYTFTLAAPADLFVTASSTAGESRSGAVELLDSTLTAVTAVAGAYSLGAGVHYVHVAQMNIIGFPDYRLSFGTLPGTSYTSAPTLAIPDNGLPATVSDVINVPAACTLSNIAVQIDLTHSFIGDLEIHLISPTGTDVMLWDRAGGGMQNIVGVFGLGLSSADPLGALIGEEAMGDWTINVGDGAPIDTGTLNSWGVLVDCQ